ncbi:MAG: hypothetical protein Kow0068_06450 [Marinilabiliales bacterium]
MKFYLYLTHSKTNLFKGMKNIVLISLIIILSLAYTSCRKTGCTDPLACNYDSEAHKDNGSCKYDRETLLYTQTVNLDDFATTNHVAEFKFEQYDIENCTNPSTSEVRLYVKNIYSDTISIDCDVVMQDDAFTQYWTYHYVGNYLAPGAIDTVGIVSTDSTPIEGKEFDFPGIYTVDIH